MARGRSVRAGIAALVGVGAVLATTGCSTAAKAKKPPQDLCALATSPPLVQFTGDDTPLHRSQYNKLTSPADCVAESDAGGLAIELERHGDTSKTKGGKWAQRSYQSKKDSESWTYRCAPTASPRLGKDSSECVSDERFRLLVRKGKDVLSFTVDGDLATRSDTADVIRSYADQVLAGLAAKK
ncbi:hypothetical protein [Streptodolium elevatio]|uniref:DUF3558 domain-containing protein n=1 Tax=Streptodolium elevatio TaxID=3157996 RepID=A0ABV3DRD7_9ACTN